ncbi:MAG: ectoine synthase [Gammaproteobacteria bacterium]|nr:ectoine synthase [Gammaproteobacteria bacterium]
MIHRTFEQLKGTPNFVQVDGFVSAPPAIASDNPGFTVTEAIGSTDFGNRDRA